MVQAAPVIETVSRKRIVPPEEIARETKMPDFWDTIEALTPAEWSGDPGHSLYIYRVEPTNSSYGQGEGNLEKILDGVIELPSGHRVNMNDRDAIADAIRQKYGGRCFRLILKRGRERLTEGKCQNEMPPKFPAATAPAPAYPGQPPVHPSMSGDAAVIGTRAIDALSGQEGRAMEVAMNILTRAAEVIQRPATIQTDPVATRVLERAVDRLFEKPDPPVSPAPPAGGMKETLELIASVKTLFAPASPASSGLKDTLELIGTLKESGLINTGGAERITMGAELVRHAPAIVQHVTAAVSEWRKGMEAQERAVALSRGMQVAGAPAAGNPPGMNPAPAGALPASAAPAGAPPPGSLDPPIDWLEMKIITILMDNGLTAKQQADDALSFLYLAAPDFVGVLVNMGEEGLLQQFQSRPILKQVPVDAKLVEFIKVFMASARAAEAKTNPAAPSAPASKTQ